MTADGWVAPSLQLGELNDSTCGQRFSLVAVFTTEVVTPGPIDKQPQGLSSAIVPVFKRCG